MIILYLLGVIALFYISLRIIQKKISIPYYLSIYFCPPGGGKTTLAAYFAKKALKKKCPVWSNVNIKGCYKLDKSDIGKFQIDHGLIILDEASIDFNNRNFKTFSQQQIEYFKLHRHYKVDIMVFSQAWDDFDITIRRLGQRYYVVGQSWIPFFVYFKPMHRAIGINEQQKPDDIYSWVPLSTKRIFSPSTWKLFNSYEYKQLENKEWEKW